MPQEQLLLKAWHGATGTMSPEAMSIHAWIMLMTKANPDYLADAMENLTFLEFIGKHDANNTPVFISDIIEADFPNEFGSFTKDIGVICFCAGCARFVARHVTRMSDTELRIDEERHWALGHDVKIRVVGNLFETPELIK